MKEVINMLIFARLYKAMRDTYFSIVEWFHQARLEFDGVIEHKNKKQAKLDEKQLYCDKFMKFIKSLKVDEFPICTDEEAEKTSIGELYMGDIVVRMSRITTDDLIFILNIKATYLVTQIKRWDLNAMTPQFKEIVMKNKSIFAYEIPQSSVIDKMKIYQYPTDLYTKEDVETFIGKIRNAFVVGNGHIEPSNLDELVISKIRNHFADFYKE